MPLSGREFSKLNAKITFEKGQIQVHAPEEKALGTQVFMLQDQKDPEEKRYLKRYPKKGKME